jgi:hypothetical protein
MNSPIMHLLVLATLALASAECDTSADARDLTLDRWRAGNRDSLDALLSDTEKRALKYGIGSFDDTSRIGSYTVREIIERGEPLRARVEGEHGNGSLR